MNNIVTVDRQQCQKTADVVKTLKFIPSFYQREYLSFPASNEIKARVFLYSLAICHQTHLLKSEKQHKSGWDYIDYIYTNFGKTNSKYLDTNYLSNQKPEILAKELGTIFSDTGKAEDSTFDRRIERADMLIDIAKVLKEKYEGQFINLLKKADGYLERSGHGLYSLLSEMKAYSGDPVNKKAGGVIKFLVDANIYHIKDWENYFPMMDYHMQRVFLRMGCVVINDSEIEKKLKNRETFSSDAVIRQACVDATKLIAELSGKEVSKLNDIFYPLGRSFCTVTTLCRDHVVDTPRMNFNLVIDLPDYTRCPFDGTCKASIDPEYIKYWQPIVETSSY